mgnify:CR=1 FL=1
MAAALAALLLLSVVAVIGLMVFLSDADRATPFIEDRIDARLSTEVTLERGWVSAGWQPVLHLRNLDIAERGRASLINARLNPLGWLFGARLIAFVEIDDGDWRQRLGGSETGSPSALRHVKGVDLSSVRLELLREGRPPSAVMIDSAAGDLASGDFSMLATGGGATIRLGGQAAGLTLDDFDGHIGLDGENFADFARLMGVSAADTPPYSLTGRVRHDGDVWSLEPFNGVVGDSDLTGSMATDFSGERQLLIADLTSENLDFNDLGVIIGAPSDFSAGEENARQASVNAAYAASARLIPDARLDFDRVRHADARLSFRADHVTAGVVPLNAMAFEFTLDNALMTFEPLVFEFETGGRMETWITINARGDAVQTSVEGGLSDFDLRNIASGALARGQLASQFDLEMTGSDLRSAFGSANGNVSISTSTNAQLRQLAAEGSALDLGEVLLLIFTEEPPNLEFEAVNCAVARIEVTEGIASANPILVDTSDSLIRMDGTVSLRTEILDLAIETDAKDVSWGNLLGGVRLGGTLRDPAVQINAVESLLQGGAAALLAGVAGPLAAIPFADLGLGESLPCGELMASQTREAP